MVRYVHIYGGIYSLACLCTYVRTYSIVKSFKSTTQKCGRRYRGLLRYLKPKDRLPDPRGTLSSSIPAAAIAQANKEVQQATNSEKQKSGPYRKYNACVRAEIGKYASHHGVAAVSRQFSQKLSKGVSETTVRSIRSAYLKGVKRKRPTVFRGSHSQMSTSPIAASYIHHKRDSHKHSSHFGIPQLPTLYYKNNYYFQMRACQIFV